MEPGSGRKANGFFPMWPRFSGCLGDEWDEIGLMKSVNGEITSIDDQGLGLGNGTYSQLWQASEMGVML